MQYVVAVSGGVDSVVLLHMLINSESHDLIVAHFDHGIRDDSADDARFVESLAAAYGLPFVTERVVLGKNANEEVARSARYDFLRRVAKEYDAKIVTAHHRDDVIETIAINLVRGTGWRGLAVMGDESIERPLLAMPKQDLYAYALKHRLEWVEDSTNNSDIYLRNRIRRALAGITEDTKRAVFELFKQQRYIAQKIDYESAQYATASRYFMTMVDTAVASELLRAWLQAQGLSLTRPQRERLLLAVKTAKPGAVFEAGDGVAVRFNKGDFIVKYPL